MLVLRWLLLAALLVVEVVWGINALTVPDFSTQAGPVAVIVGSGAQLFKMAAAFAATFLLVLSRDLTSLTDFFRQQTGYRWWPWLASHGVALAAFLNLSWPVLGPSADAERASGEWLILTLGAGTFALAFLLLAAAPIRLWLNFFHREWAGAVIAMIAGVVAYVGGLLAQSVWLPLARTTFWSTRHLLSLIYSDVYSDGDKTLVGVNDFAVQIAPVCSGYEGMALITVFVTVYLWLFRADLRFPHALLLLPVGLAVIWVANVIRIATLVVIGASFSPEVAVTGFHSQAGWISFSIVALGTIAGSHRLLLVAPRGKEVALPISHAGLATALLAPLLTSLAVSMLIAALSSGFAALYPFGVLATAAVLWHYRGYYRALGWTLGWEAIAIGVAVFLVWLILVPADDGSGESLVRGLADLPAWLMVVWIIFRVFGSVATVPVAEELAFRGYIIRKLVDRNFENVLPGQFTWLSFIGSSLVFGLMHESWLAGTVAGAGYALALYRRGAICDAIVAHMTTNALIAIAVLGFGRWALWN
jgi:exosortase E/protease (VPEID-CTERM system)